MSFVAPMVDVFKAVIQIEKTSIERSELSSTLTEICF